MPNPSGITVEWSEVTQTCWRLERTQNVRSVRAVQAKNKTKQLHDCQSPLIPQLVCRACLSSLTSMSRGRRVIRCMGRMRKEIIGRFLQSGWASILVNTSLKVGFVDLRKQKREEINGKRVFSQKKAMRSTWEEHCEFPRSLTATSAEFSAGRPHWSSR